MYIHLCRTILVASLLLLLGWMILIFPRERGRHAWWAQYDETDISTIVSETGEVSELPEAQAYSEVASVAQNNIFPPQTDLANELILNAIQRQPFRSAHWIDRSYILAKAGNSEDALRYLLHAETLDPGFVDLQIEAITLWLLLGDEGKALRNFSHVANLSPQDQPSAVSSLFLGGIRFQAFADLVNWDQMTESTFGNFMSFVARESPRDYWSVLSTAHQNRPELINSSREIASAITAQNLTASWYFESQILGRPVTFPESEFLTPENGELFPNVGLEQNPFDVSTADQFGWFRGTDKLQTVWLQSLDGEQGVLQLDIPANSAERPNLYFFRAAGLILTPEMSGRRLSLKINANESEELVFTVSLFTRENRQFITFEENRSQVDSGNWTTFDFLLPEIRRSQYYHLRLDLDQRRSTSLAPARLYLSGLSLEEPSNAPE